MRRIAVFVLVCGVCVAPASALAQQAAQADASEVTWDEVRGVFQKRCFACHRGEQARGGLDLSTAAAIQAGSTSGAAVVSGKPEQSLIYTLPAHLEDPKMPPNGTKLPQRELDLISRWITGGMSEKVRDAGADSKPDTARVRVGRQMRPGTAALTAGPGGASLAVTSAAPEKAEVSPMKPVFAKPVRQQHRAVTALAASPTSSLMAVPGHREVLVFDWSDQSLRQRIAFPWGDVFALSFSVDGSLLIVGGGIGAETGRAAGFDVLTGEQVFVSGEEPDVVLAVDLSADGRLLAVGGPSRTVRIYDTVRGERIAEMTRHTDWILQLAFSHDGLLLASGDRFGAVIVSETRNGHEFASLRGHSGPISALAWSKDSSEVFSASQDGSIRSRELHQGTEELVLNPGRGRVLDAVFLPAGGVVVGTSDRSLAIVEHSGDVRSLAQSGDEVVRLAVTQDGSHVLSADAAGRLMLHSLANGERLSLPAALLDGAE
ncbi:MAG: c-type cytochrome domain-containing protein [Planctomycetota bacterium]